ncbi:hypothetical protein JTB14_036879 [Gonioctena quinquepunctata]|nr:hypothetical protein JTB14_036879 [Gonioctena quinquepunctata]
MRSKELLDSVLTRNRDDPSRGESLERKICHGDFWAPLEVKAEWIYRLKKSELMELAANFQINPGGTVIQLRRRLVWHLVELPKSLRITTYPGEGAGNYFFGLRNKKPFGYIETYHPNIVNIFEEWTSEILRLQ